MQFGKSLIIRECLMSDDYKISKKTIGAINYFHDQFLAHFKNSNPAFDKGAIRLFHKKIMAESARFPGPVSIGQLASILETVHRTFFPDLDIAYDFRPGAGIIEVVNEWGITGQLSTNDKNLKDAMEKSYLKTIYIVFLAFERNENAHYE